jgi:hypothetical protein
MCIWATAIDDCVEQDVTELAKLDEVFDRCSAIVRGGVPSDDSWLLTALYSLQQDLACRPLYPALANLWVGKFESFLRSTHHEWVAGRSPRRDLSGVNDYLEHSDNVAAWITHLTRWITYGDATIVENLDTLTAALAESVVAIRLANDLATFSRECEEHGHDNILMYEISADWVENQISLRTEKAAELLADLIAKSFVPAVELLRELEYAVTFYSIADFRVWSSDSH